jgi:hypothetical protein
MFLNGMLVVDGDRPRVLANGQPDWRFAVFHRTDAEILDTWDAIGLRGTGSHDVTTTDTFVPEEHVFMPFDTYARHDGPLWRFSFWGVLSIVMAGLPIGIARHALDTLAEMAPVRRRAASPDPLGTDPSIQIEVARAEGQLLAARALLTDVVGDVGHGLQRRSPHPRQEAHAAGDAGRHAGQHARVDVAFAAAGASVVYRSSPLGRCFRDIHTAGQHVAFGRDGLRNTAGPACSGPTPLTTRGCQGRAATRRYGGRRWLVAGEGVGGPAVDRAAGGVPLERRGRSARRRRRPRRPRRRPARRDGGPPWPRPRSRPWRRRRRGDDDRAHDHRRRPARRDDGPTTDAPTTDRQRRVGGGGTRWTASR